MMLLTHLRLRSRCAHFFHNSDIYKSTIHFLMSSSLRCRNLTPPDVTHTTGHRLDNTFCNVEFAL